VADGGIVDLFQTASRRAVAPPARRAAGLRPILALAAGAVAFILVAHAIQGVLGNRSDTAPRVRTYVSGAAVEPFFASDLGFRAAFPAAPARSTTAVDVDGRPRTVVIYSSALGDGEMIASGMDMPSGAEFGLAKAVDRVAAAVRGHLDSSAPIDFAGFPAAEFVISLDHGHFIKGLFVRAPDRVYQLQVMGRTNPPAGYDRFKHSFEVVQP
jgi:hypothetical protein